MEPPEATKEAIAPPPSAAPAHAPAASPLPPLPKHPLKDVHNFRDVGTSVTGIRTGMIFRSGAPLKGSSEDLAYLVETCKVRTMIDLRSDRERELDEERNQVHHHFPCKYDFSQQRPVGDESRRYHTVHLTGAHFVFRLLWESPISTSFKAIGHAVRGAPEKATLELITSLNGRGLLNLYRMFIDCSQGQICQVIHLFSSRENYPVHYFCSLGKDRTGIITDRDQICNDYSRSRDDVALTGDMRAAMSATNLSDEFLDSPKEVMQATLQYLDATWGSPKAYLERIGVPRAVQAKVKEILTGPTPASSLSTGSASRSVSNSPSPAVTPNIPPSSSDDVAHKLAGSPPPFLSKSRQAQSMGELHDRKVDKKERKDRRRSRHEEEKKLKEEKKEEKKESRRSRGSEPPKLSRAAQSTMAMEVLTDADVEREGKAQVYLWDPKEHAMKKEKENASEHP